MKTVQLSSFLFGKRQSVRIDWPQEFGEGVPQRPAYFTQIAEEQKRRCQQFEGSNRLKSQSQALPQGSELEKMQVTCKQGGGGFTEQSPAGIPLSEEANPSSALNMWINTVNMQVSKELGCSLYYQ